MSVFGSFRSGFAYLRRRFAARPELAGPADATSHPHGFDESDWPFDDPINTLCFTTRHVLDGSRQVLEVYHDHEGDWQFMCGITNAPADGKVVCLGCMIDRDPTLTQLADMPSGWFAYRESPDEPWWRQAYKNDDV
ncbi:hypothetical protein [Pseudomonas sp. CGJS7]|uniref:hypothetical protein n=1 Tax=Pseudomonas sp. CGJS7 TaxID=3109348 RepID=UPI00300A8A08